MKQYIFSTQIFIAALCIALLHSCNSLEREISDLTSKKTHKPNVILFVSDDHGTDALGCYGNPVIDTKNLDKLAAEGVKFSNAYCTSASCAASRSVILTGKYGHATGSYGHVHDYHHFSTYDTIASLPVLLEESGYLTARIGKYHLAPEDVYKFGKIIKSDERSTVEMANKCQEVLEAGQPFFLYFCTGDPHRGAPFNPEKWNIPNNFGNREEGYPGVEEKAYNPDSVLVPEFLPNTRECREELAQYYQSVSRIDQGFGRLMALLEQSGKMDNTIIIYISDNGMAFPGAKTTLYEPGIKLPCIIKSPFVKNKGITNNAMISWVDLTPTILDMANINFNVGKFHGRSFNDILDQENSEGWDEVYASHTFHEITMYYPMRVCRSGNYKLIWNLAWRLDYPFASDLWSASTWQGVLRKNNQLYGKRAVKDYLFRPEFELYNLLNDPGELNNLAFDESKKETIQLMKKKVMDFQKKTSDPWMILWDKEATLQGTGVGL